MRKILLLLIIGMFLLVPMISAFEFDNVKNYDETEKKITIRNSILGIPTTKVAEIRLESDLHKLVPIGYQEVAKFSISSYEDYSEALKQMKFYNIKSNMKEIQREFDYKILSYELVEVDDYNYICNDIFEKPLDVCNKVKSGSHYENKEAWTNFNGRDIMKDENITIGIFTEVKQGDKVEWIPTFFGIEIIEWASFEAVVLSPRNMTSNTAPSPFIAWASSEDSNFSGYHLFDGIEAVSDSWRSLSSGGEWVALDMGLGNQFAATNITLFNEGSGTARVGATEFYGSNDNSTWINLLSYSFANVGGNQTANFSNNINYRYYRFNITTNQGASSIIVDSFYIWGGVIHQLPNITLISPENNSNFNQNNVTFNVDVTDNDSAIQNVSLLIDGVLNETNSSGFDGTYIFEKNISDGNHNWSVIAVDTDIQQQNSSTRIFLIDTIVPQITLNLPNATPTFAVIGGLQEINWTITDLNFDSIFLDYNGTNITGVGVANNTSITLEENNFNITIFTNDTAGNSNTTTFTWEYKALEINQTFSNETTEGNIENFLAAVRLGSGLSISNVVLFYNGSSNIGQSFISGSDTILRKENLVIPNVDSDANITLYWEITLSDSTILNLTSKNQTIFSIGLDNCTTNTNTILNFTMLEEELQTVLTNTTFEIAVNIFDINRENSILNESGTFTINPTAFCLNINLTGSSNYSLDTIVRYEAQNHVSEYYNIVNLILNNDSAIQNINLYSLNSSDSTEFQLTFTGSDFLPVEEALVFVDRQYIQDNNFKTVELPRTDSNGQTVLHLVRNSIIYNLRIVKDNVVLGNFENIIAFCEDFTIGNCEIILNAFDSTQAIFDYNEDLGLIFTEPVFNETLNRISFNFLTSDGTSQLVSMNVSRNDIFGNRSICNSSIVSSGATLICDIDPNLDETVLKTDIFLNENLVVKANVKLDTENQGEAGYLIFLVMAISFIFMFSTSKTGVLFGIFLSFVGAIGLSIISSDVIGIGASGLWLIVIIFLGIWKLNKEKRE